MGDFRKKPYDRSRLLQSKKRVKAITTMMMVIVIMIKTEYKKCFCHLAFLRINFLINTFSKN